MADIKQVYRVKDEGSATIAKATSNINRDLKSSEGGMKGLAKGATSAFGGMLAAINPVTLAIAGATLGLAALGKGIQASVKEYAKYEKEMAGVSTLVDTSIVDMGRLKEEIMSLPNELGTATEMTQALYQAMSGGQEASKAVAFVADAAKAAKAGMSNAFVAVDAGTTILNSFGEEAGTAMEVFDKMFVAVKAGKTTFEQLASSIGKVAPLAAQMGLGVGETLAAVSALTTTGQKTSEAVTSLKAAFANILKPTSEAEKIMADTGLEFTAAGLKAKGLQKFMEDLSVATDGNVETMAKMFGSTEALNSILFLTGKGANKFAEINEAMGASAGETETAFGKMDNTLSASFDKLDNSMNKLGVVVGEVLAPAVKAVVDGLTLVVEGFTKTAEVGGDFIKWVQKGREYLDQFAVTLGPFRFSLLALVDPFKAIAQLVKNVWEYFKFWLEILANLSVAIENIDFSNLTSIKGIKEEFEKFGQLMAAPFEFVIDALKDVIETLKKWIKLIPGFGQTEEEKAAKEAADAIKQTTKESEKAAKEAAKQIKEAGKEAENYAKQMQKAYDYANDITGSYDDQAANLQKIIQMVNDAVTAQTGWDQLFDEEAGDDMDKWAEGSKKRVNDLQDALDELGFDVDVDTAFLSHTIDVEDTLKKVNKALEKFKELAEEGVTLNTQFTGQGSTVKPLTEKTAEMTEVLKGFETNVNNSDPKVKVAFEDVSGKSLSSALSTTEGELNGMFSTIVDGTFMVQESFADMVTNILTSISKMLTSEIISKFIGLLGGAFSPTPAPAMGGTGTEIFAAKGGVFNSGNVIPFARGGVVNSPTVFPMANGTGLMGEAGPEAVVPLKRTSDGSLGIASEGGGSVNNLNIYAMDSQSFTEFARRNPGAFAAVMSDMSNKGNSSFTSAIKKAVR